MSAGKHNEESAQVFVLDSLRLNIHTPHQFNVNMKNSPFQLSAILFLASLTLSGSASSAVLVGWNGWTVNSGTSYTTDVTTTGFTGNVVYKGNRDNASFGSNDGTYGTVAGAPTGGGSLLPRTQTGGNVNLELTITNNSGASQDLNSVNFDLGYRNGSYTTVDVTYVSGGLGPASALVGSAFTNTAISPDISNYADFDLDLSTTLTDTTLDDGQSALFSFAFSGGTDDSTSLVFDNLAIVGTIPEPSASVLALGAAGLLLRRRR